MNLFLLDVPLQGNDLHAVNQRRRNRIQHVRRADKERLRQVERHVEVVVAEGVVLRRVQRLQQRRCRIAAKIAPQLVHLVQHDDRVVRLRAPDALNNLPRQRADVRAPVAANLGFVVHAAQRHALELAPERPCNGLAETGLAHTRRSDKAQNRPLHVRLQLQNAEVVENALLHLLQAVVVLVQNFAGLDGIHLGARALRPGQHGKPLNVIARERVVRCHRRHA